MCYVMSCVGLRSVALIGVVLWISCVVVYVACVVLCCVEL